jgi:hypothetical protein
MDRIPVGFPTLIRTPVERLGLGDGLLAEDDVREGWRAADDQVADGNVFVEER